MVSLSPLRDLSCTSDVHGGSHSPLYRTVTDLQNSGGDLEVVEKFGVPDQQRFEHPGGLAGTGGASGGTVLFPATTLKEADGRILGQVAKLSHAKMRHV